MRLPRFALFVTAISIVGPFVGDTARAEKPGNAPVLHEPLPANPREDVSFDLTLSGDLPAAIQTPNGLVSAPDPGRPVDGNGSEHETPYGANSKADPSDGSFKPDRDTRRPDVLPYDDPFTPSTTPFKRLMAFDMVDASYTLSVRSNHLEPLTVSAASPVAANEQSFYADMVVDLAPGANVRIPSVGPGTRVLRARAGVGSEDVPIRLYRDGAENWFVLSNATKRVRLVMELAIARTAFGGDYGDPAWTDLPRVTALPTRVAVAAKQVAAKIGVAGPASPRDKLNKLVAYFRSFADSEDPPTPSNDIYLDLALSKKGVCRHRSFAFMVTALSVGLPTRMVVNEAHAWVEVHDGRAFRRIDLGGAGVALEHPLADKPRYEPPNDPFAWPHGSSRGDELAQRAQRGSSGARGRSQGNPGTSTSGANATDPTAPTRPGEQGRRDENHGRTTADGAPSTSTEGSADPAASSAAPDERVPSTLTLTVEGASAKRGALLHVSGRVSSSERACPHVTVDVVLHRNDGGEVILGRLATDDRGAYDGPLLLPTSMPLGDYDVRAKTAGDTRCGPGSTR